MILVVEVLDQSPLIQAASAAKGAKVVDHSGLRLRIPRM